MTTTPIRMEDSQLWGGGHLQYADCKTVKKLDLKICLIIVVGTIYIVMNKIRGLQSLSRKQTS